MKKFVVIYHAPADAWQQSEQASQEDMGKGMEAWMEWARKCGDKLLDMGTPLAHGQKLKPGGAFENSVKQVVGYSLLQAGSMDEARDLLKDHPHLAWTPECEIEVHESLPTPGS